MKTLLVRAALVLALAVPFAAAAQVSVVITVAPPPLPIYAQPPAPGDGYIWMPGYWVWSEAEGDYYWVPATWVLAPEAGELWTPGYWAFEGSGYFWHMGYWGPSVGFYGGVNYGYGYTGSGYQGGRWDRGVFRYNRAASNIDPARVHNFYNAPVVDRAPATHASFNGGAAGTRARPTAPERRVQAGEHAGPTADQLQHERQATAQPEQRASVSRGAPPVAATPRPSAFTEPGVERARPGAPPARPAQLARPQAQPRPEPQPRAEAQVQAPPQRAAPQQQRPERAAPESRGAQRQEEQRR